MQLKGWTRLTQEIEAAEECGDLERARELRRQRATILTSDKAGVYKKLMFTLHARAKAAEADGDAALAEKLWNRRENVYGLLAAELRKRHREQERMREENATWVPGERRYNI